MGRSVLKSMVVLFICLLVSGSIPGGDDQDRIRAEQEELRQLVKKCSPAFCAIGAGSGVCIRSDGLLVTNEHVAGDRERWAVLFGDGRPPLMARRLGVDERGDVCLLQVEGDHRNLPCIPLGDSTRLKPGERVMALGNPWVLSQDGKPTVTFGVISALHYSHGGNSNAIVTDTPVNPGNSGGPLINMRGEVVGINSRIVTRFPRLRFNTGIAFSVPSSHISNYLKTLSGEETIWHGGLRDLTVYTFENPRGVAVSDVFKSGPSYRAGLRFMDVITHVNGIPVTTEAQFEGLLATFPAGSRVLLSVERENKAIKIEVTLSSVENPVTGIFLGVKSPRAPIDETLTLQIDRIEEGGAAEKAGLKVGDILTHMDGEEIRNARQFFRWVKHYYPGKTLHITVLRGDRSMVLPLILSGKQN